MKTLILTGAVLASLLTSPFSYAGSYAIVSNGNNDGAGSLRNALNSGAKIIRITNQVKTITITEGLEYTQPASLKIIGRNQVINGAALTGDTDILTLTEGANLTISNLKFVGNGDEFNPDPSVPTGGKGIFVDVPSSRTGLVKVRLDNVSVFRVGNHGVHISDCTLGDDCGAGSGGGGEGSAASIAVKLNNVQINGVGFGRADADGIRVDDRSDGNIYFSANNSQFLNVGADGVELDEGNDGNVIVDVRNSIFDSNGEYCNLVPNFEGTPCDDDGDRDVDDGFDIDEAGVGSIYVSVRDTTVTNNFDEGLDYDEEGENGIQARLTNVYAADNQDEGIKMSEEDGGDVHAVLHRINTIANNGSREGIELEEEDDGNVSVFVINSSLIGGEGEELKIEQTDDGVGTVKVKRSTVVLDLDGVSEL